jgi:hypothetical protein
MDFYLVLYGKIRQGKMEYSIRTQFNMVQNSNGRNEG